MKDCGAEDSMERLFKDSRTIRRFRSGPLGPCIQQLAEELVGQGHARCATRLRLRVAYQFGLWLAKCHIEITNLTACHGEQYVAKYGNVKQGDAKTVRMLFDILVRRGIVRSRQEPAKTEAERVVDAFSAYLQEQRALAPRTIKGVSQQIRFFLAFRFGIGAVDLSLILPEDVIAFVRHEAARKCAASAKNTTSALKSFSQYLQFSCGRGRELELAVPSVAHWSLSNIPKGLSRPQVTRVLINCDRKTPIGRRDYAVLLLLARLGLRSGESAFLTLDDIDWSAGTISVRSKSSKSCQLPLPLDVGAAIATYLQKDRPVVSSRRVFLRIPAPHIGFEGPRAISLIVKYALQRAGIHSRSQGAHQFRHALATEMLKHGAALVEIGHILRHSNPKTTFIYAKVDLVALLPLARRWPGGVA
jgi:integrase/recombinase XerD